jgi:Flp pilus assembly protein TadG
MNRSLARLTANRKGGAALELALVAPVVLLLLLGATDLILEFRNWMRLHSVTTQVGQIVAQCQHISDPYDLNIFFADAEQIAAPLDIVGSTNGAVVITAIGPDSSNKLSIYWQKRVGSGAFNSGITSDTLSQYAISGVSMNSAQTFVVVEAFSRPGLWQFASKLIGSSSSPVLSSQSVLPARFYGSNMGVGTLDTTATAKECT